jgi:hypothetical protein
MTATQTTWTVMSPKGYVDESVTAADAEAAKAQVEARGHTVVDIMDDTIVIADESIADETLASVTEIAPKPKRASRASRAAAKNAPADPPADVVIADLPDGTVTAVGELISLDDAPPAEGTPVDDVATPTEAVVPPKAARVPAVRVERATTEHGAPPEGYLVLKATPSYDQFRKADATAEGPDWLTRCNLHGNTTPADNRKAGRTLGSAASRAQWCKGCKADAAKAARAAAKAEADKPATADATSDATSDATAPATSE